MPGEPSKRFGPDRCDDEGLRVAEEYIETEARIVRPEGGGIELHIKGFEKPFPGWPDEQVIRAMDPHKLEIKNLLKLFHDAIGKYMLHPLDCCVQVRELHGGFNKLIEAETGEELKQFWAQVRDIICVVLEYDTSYRWRLSWMIEQMDIEKLKLTENDRYWLGLKQDFKGK